MTDPKCALCKPRYCNEGITDEEKLPSFCPMKDFKNLIQEVKEKYSAEEIKNLFLSAALTEKEAYEEKPARELGKIIPVRPRIREIAEFAKKIGARKIGMAFCSGLSDEASRAHAILEKHELEIVSVICSCGAVDKEEVGIPKEYKIRDPKKFESACNPLLQAELLNKAETAFNVLVGLCVGHDMLFTKHSQAPVTTLIVKDRFTGHNPLISLYTRYHKDIV
ncbi:MAG: DUF1847 domain-containing protein [Candidatus Aminicenantes bacterium]|nr:DUF1847 domain-containing protein [Candidatus Aminicenantes bacterium]MDH5743093.1 DUF1847 domain-containing protein [Candidatus Aminicenantes bacterium]